MDLVEQHGNDQIELAGCKAVLAADTPPLGSAPPDLVEHGVAMWVAALCVTQNIGAVARAFGPDEPTKIVALAPGSCRLESTLGLWQFVVVGDRVQQLPANVGGGCRRR